MKRSSIAFACICLLAVAASVPALAATAKVGSAAGKAGIARPVSDIVALAPIPLVYQPNAVGCPQTMCVPVGPGWPEFDLELEIGPTDYPYWTWQCVYVQGSNRRCLSSSGGLCTGTVSCDGLSY